jgi:hypothetical protein
VKSLVSVRTKQSTVFGTLLTIAIGLITWGVTQLQENIEEWYIGAVAIILGLVLAIVDTYVLKGQENC